MKNIAVAGRIRSGKDTVGKYLIDNYSYFKLAFGDGIKETASILFPEAVKKGKPRRLYQVLGQKMREIDPDVWVKYLDRRMTLCKRFGIEKFIVTDLRQFNEYDYLKEKGFVIVKVEADEEIRRQRMIEAGDDFTEEDLNHETELSVDALPYDYLITNNGTLEELYEQIEFIIDDIKGE
jgi:dephospho-CoA kinase